MSGVYYGVFVIAILVVIRWCQTNDISGGDGSAGLLAMTARRRKDDPAGPRKKSRFRRTARDR